MKYQNPSRNINSTEFEVNNNIICDFISNTLLPKFENRPFPFDELMLMTATVCRFKPKLILEWGTNTGNSARIFYEIIEAFDIDSEIHSTDLPDDIEHIEHSHNYRGMMVKNINKVTLHQGDGLDCSFNIIKNKIIKDNEILFFLDGDHEYSSVKRELDSIISNMPNSIILVHDTLYQSENSGYNVGPYKAIHDACTNNYKILSTFMGGPGMTLIYKMNG